ncbi:hypothetical protein DAEQUDRAFT_725449 [Daedalea quercina L-15889]|uniref:Uncharacterized protein n=1 Tax=Daedalea quercina L-15889 TaxID=1314783 RepID=A0A165RAT3_9APHY|nr:hypothetical protein DAEQUDRAFT_725449 [Daedalea quercina L-15889]
MSASYYREQTHFYPSVQDTVSSNASQSDGHTQDGNVTQGSTQSHPLGPPRYCTVKGCAVILLPDYLHKMCEACRGRHRIYAMTKRAKRKMEKAALGSQGGQPVVWMPPDDTVEGEGEEGDGREVSQSSQPEESQRRPDTTDAYRYPPNSWDHGAIDPTLFSQESALAGALTLPGSSQQSMSAIGLRQDVSPALDASSGSASAPLANNLSSMNLQTGMQLPLTSLSPAIFGRPSDGQDESAPPRLCSIKGCKAFVAGNSFFKMCEPCRDRYRNYGITKRAKWKQEKQIAVAELQKGRDEEDQRRAEAGLPPLPKPTDPEWHEWQADGTMRMQTPQSADGSAGPSVSRPTRMCTVSHCREILPTDYQFLRCDRHRLQNRHHSKLKRVRDKEVKAAAFNHWIVSVGGHNCSEASPAPAQDDDPEEEEEHGVSYDNEGTPGTGFPPAARGMRRTNHSCIIKACYNLLSPTNPWRMCDVCRARDRAHRREKALRASGVITTPLPSEKDAGDGTGQGQGEGGEQPKKKKKKKKKKKANDAATVPQDAVDLTSASAPAPPAPSSSAVQGDPQGTGLVFMAPLLPSKPSSPAAIEHSLPPSDVPVDPPPPVDVVPTDDAPPAASPRPASAPSTRPFQIVSAEEIASRSAQAESTAAPSKKKRKIQKSSTTSAVSATVRANAEASTSTAGSSAHAPAAPVLVHPPVPVGHEMHAPPPPFPVDGPPPPGVTYPPYYMPPYGMPTYAGQPPHYPYSHYGPHYQYPPPPYGYQPPYPPYSQAYPYSAVPPYGPSPYSAGGPPPPPQGPPHVPGTYSVSVSADFVSRADYAAASQNVQQQGVTQYGGPRGTAPHYATFSAKTGEPHNRVSSVPSVLRRKRPLEGEGVFSVSEQPAARSSSNLTEQPAPPPPLPPVHVIAASSQGVTSDIRPEASTESSGPTDAMTQAICSNQKCHRPLPANHNGSLCARCRERLRKRSDKAKHRFKLEPRKLVRKASVGAAHDEAGDGGHADLYAAEAEGILGA